MTRQTAVFVFIIIVGFASLYAVRTNDQSNLKYFAKRLAVENRDALVRSCTVSNVDLRKPINAMIKQFRSFLKSAILVRSSRHDPASKRAVREYRSELAKVHVIPIPNCEEVIPRIR